MQRAFVVARQRCLVAKPIPRQLQRCASTASSKAVSVSASATCAPGTEHRVSAPTAQAMDCLAALFASHIRAGDCYCLFGAVGAGKSVFSRSFIRAVAEDDFLPVPSPTFLLQNTYDEHQGPPIHHFDFYRLASVQDFNRLDLEGSLTRAVCLMEWPERLPVLPGEYLAVNIEVVDELPELPPQSASSAGSGDFPGALVLPSLGIRRSRKAPRGRAFAVSDSYDSDSESSFVATDSAYSDVDTEQELEEFTDRRPRIVTLTPFGSYWEGRARRIMSYIAAHSHACEGLVVLNYQESETAAVAASNGSSGVAAGAAAGVCGGSGGAE
ncbi:hypothetical protein CHLRE_12g547000v5 [Chlamydomonas reinhardtii]|uniref:tRNA threonylcarbamoyladenosine biosynthesis protein TsaE n=1 Tax=Chlamydomonas reinhardtii TaxID=3055 RepID=A0A2K3D6G8_CHLRE|nr:uncharacterized protein CHLRE_12g547000v5 [Chlamydomonas reinhardtii]PNW76120.1 hypothetical protein CHLRE_12g547000v5 [Chlamydomonas reinhardtii]